VVSQKVVLIGLGGAVALGIYHAIQQNAGVKYSGQIIEIASSYGIPTPLALAQVKLESNFDPRAISIAGARGLLQLKPAALADVNRSLGTAYSFDDMFVPSKNLIAGFHYLALKREQFGSLYAAYVAYYAGHFPDSSGAAYADTIYNISKGY
jgi:soluble lytic murein transglycosylase-like protein